VDPERPTLKAIGAKRQFFRPAMGRGSSRVGRSLSRLDALLDERRVRDRAPAVSRPQRVHPCAPEIGHRRALALERTRGP
jgi:hypothetical protein